MNRTPAVEIVAEGLSLMTRGLAAEGHPEIKVGGVPPPLRAEAEGFLRFVAGYVAGQGARISPGETLAYGYWLTKFVEAGDRHLEVWEYNAGATEFVAGASLTLTYWRDQHEVCDRVGADFAPPRPDRLVVLSDGVLEGDAVQGVRYPSPEHMTGWWITTDRYDGDTNSLRREHVYHLTAARPDLARYVALPHGFRFDLGSREDIWFDQRVAQQPAS